VIFVILYRFSYALRFAYGLPIGRFLTVLGNLGRFFEQQAETGKQ
jgi:hypothetical protein